MKATIVIEKGTDGMYSCYMRDEMEHFGLSGYGTSVEEAKSDLLAAYEEIKALEQEEGRDVPELQFVYKYDIQSFFNYFSFLNVSKVAERAGINPSLMRQYTSGTANAGQRQYEKLRAAVRGFAKEFSLATF